MKYADKLKYPRWQKKRLKILERDEFKCQCCNNDKETLNVHHLIYSDGEPWDVDDKTLETLCRSCHEWREEFNLFFGRSLHPTNFVVLFMETWQSMFKTPISGKIQFRLKEEFWKLFWMIKDENKITDSPKKENDSSNNSGASGK